MVVVEPVGGLLTEAALTRLDSSHLAEVLAGRSSLDGDVVALATQVEADQSRLDQLAGLYAAAAGPRGEPAGVVQSGQDVGGFQRISMG